MAGVSRPRKIARSREGRGKSSPPAGIEQPKSSRRKTRSQGSGDVRSDVVDRRTAKAPSQIDPEAIADLASRLASLPPEALAALQSLFGGQPRRP
jgi:hypothetical protein